MYAWCVCVRGCEGVCCVVCGCVCVGVGVVKACEPKGVRVRVCVYCLCQNYI